MKKISKKDLYIIIGVVAVIIIVILIAVFSNRQGPVNNNLNATPSNEQNAQNENKPSESNASTSVPVTTTAPSLLYGEALKMYGDRRFQFGLNDINNCIMTPSSSVFKEGTKVMLDNRANKQITIYLDGTAYDIKAYGFRIITLTTSASLPHTIKVDCNTGKNNGQILLQQ